MDNIPNTNREEDRAFKEFLTHYDAPAYIRRARHVQEAYDLLVTRCRNQRADWLKMVRIRVGQLHALVDGDWDRLRPFLAEGAQTASLRELHAELQPRLRVSVAPTTSAWVLRRALAELGESIERFNQRWQPFLAAVDVSPVNKLRDGYNRYYLLEKECAVRSSTVARMGFRRLEPMRVEELFMLFPPLPIFRIQ